MKIFIKKVVLILGVILLAACGNNTELNDDTNTVSNSETPVATALPLPPGLTDDEECKTGSNCSCGFVTCAVGCTCEMTGPTGICTGCPIPDVPSINIPVEEQEAVIEATAE